MQVIFKKHINRENFSFCMACITLLSIVDKVNIKKQSTKLKYMQNTFIKSVLYYV